MTMADGCLNFDTNINSEGFEKSFRYGGGYQAKA